MDIKGPHSFGGYDAKHIAHVQREIARSVKPNLLRQLEDNDMDEAAFMRLLTEDLVDLSPEAKEMLRSLRKERARRKTKKEDPSENNSDFLSLLTGLEDFRKQVEEGQRQQGDEAFRGKGKPFMPPSLPLSQHVPRATSHESSASWRRPRLDEAGELARKMVVYAPRPELKEQLALELQVFGKAIIQQVKQFGVRVIILERHKALTDIRIQGMMMVAPSERTFDGRPWGAVRGIYCSDRRLFVVGEELVGRPEGSVARHEFAHAYDHTFSQKNHRRLPLSVQLWNSFRQERTGLVSAYAATNPAEYFAESVEAFFQEGARDALRQQDPLMYDYLKQLFAA